MTERLISFICEELGCDESNVGKETMLNDLVGDEIELQELVDILQGLLRLRKRRTDLFRAFGYALRIRRQLDRYSSDLRVIRHS